MLLLLLLLGAAHATWIVPPAALPAAPYADWAHYVRCRAAVR